jgi:hypothetical protein
MLSIGMSVPLPVHDVAHGNACFLIGVRAQPDGAGAQRMIRFKGAGNANSKWSNEIESLPPAG